MPHLIVPDCRKPYPADDAPGCYRVPLSQGRTAVIDGVDVERVGRFVWSYTPCPKELTAGCACRQAGPTANPRSVYLSRFVIRAAPDERVEYLDGNTLNCRRANLRRVSKRAPTNGRARKWRRPTTSVFKGVYFYARQQTWKAGICVNGRTVHLGTFATETEAAQAYDAAAREHFGPEARLNLPDVLLT